MAGNQEYTYKLIRKNVKNINLRVKSDGSITVSASPEVPKEYIDDFVQSQISFIQKARARIEQKKNSIQQQKFLPGEKVPYLGRLLTLQIRSADTRKIPEWIEKSQTGSITVLSRNNHGEAVFCQNECLYIYAKQADNPLSVQQLYEDWQKIQTGILCRQISRKYYPVFEKLGVIFPEIKIRKMTSRWGSCIPGKQKITFNSHLLEKPLESIEYVVVHEFSHFIHPDHSKSFYNFVEQILPDWKERKAGLSRIPV